MCGCNKGRVKLVNHGVTLIEQRIEPVRWPTTPMMPVMPIDGGARIALPFDPDDPRAMELILAMAERDRRSGLRRARRSSATEPSTDARTPREDCDRWVCGPDVTDQVKEAVEKTKSTFAGWSAAQREQACHSLNNLPAALFSWDIEELYAHNNAWVLRTRPTCATEGATPPCGTTVEVNDQCYYMGSVNYVIFGVMCKLCEGHFGAAGNAGRQSEYNRESMLNLIHHYKATLPALKLQGPAKNLNTAKDWAAAGYDGWPAVMAPPGDRNHCKPECSIPYTGGPFTVRWGPLYAAP